MKVLCVASESLPHGNHSIFRPGKGRGGEREREGEGKSGLKWNTLIQLGSALIEMCSPVIRIINLVTDLQMQG